MAAASTVTPGTEIDGDAKQKKRCRERITASCRAPVRRALLIQSHPGQHEINIAHEELRCQGVVSLCAAPPLRLDKIGLTSTFNVSAHSLRNSVETPAKHKRDFEPFETRRTNKERTGQTSARGSCTAARMRFGYDRFRADKFPGGCGACQPQRNTPTSIMKSAFGVRLNPGAPVARVSSSASAHNHSIAESSDPPKRSRQ